MDSRGLVNLEELRKNFSKADFKDGGTSYCFIVGDKIVKIYAQKEGSRRLPKQVCDFSKYHADTIVFPDEYIYENGIIVGEISKFIHDKQINQSFNDKTQIKKLINNYELVLQDMELYKNIWMEDLGFVNILYSNKNGFHIIDTTEWVMCENGFHNNVRQFNIALLDTVFQYLGIDYKQSRFYNRIDEELCRNLNKFGVYGKKINDQLILFVHGEIDFLGILFSFMDLYQNYCGQDMRTLKDMQEITKVLKKG